MLSISCLLCFSSIEFGILLQNRCFYHLSFVIFNPSHFTFLLLFVKNVLFSRVVYILEEVNSSLIFSDPLCLSHLVLSLGFSRDEFIDKFFKSTFISFRFLVIFLELNNFSSSYDFFSFFNISNIFLSFNSSFKKFSISCTFYIFLCISKNLFGGVVFGKFDISFFIKNEFLSLCLFITLNFFCPLGFKHCLFLTSFVVFNFNSLFLFVDLPCQNIDHIVVLFLLNNFFFSTFFGFSFAVEHPKLSINLVFNNTLFDFTLFVHELLFSFELAACNHKCSLFFSQFVGFHFEFTIEGVGNKLNSFFFSSLFKIIKSDCHFGSNLFWGFKCLHKFMLILCILGS